MKFEKLIKQNTRIFVRVVCAGGCRKWAKGDDCPNKRVITGLTYNCLSQPEPPLPEAPDTYEELAGSHMHSVAGGQSGTPFRMIYS